ncbi:MAG: hypothetical protein PHT53_04505 [Candidatus Omnitrophica bacterium]|nr:hypothetical protein [Candidatus Omnitrophota bacterium]
MNKKQLIVILLSVSLFVCCQLLAQSIPQELQNLGFTQNKLISYDKEGNEEFFTFADLKESETGETITFVIENGKVKQTIRGQTAKFLETDS